MSFFQTSEDQEHEELKFAPVYVVSGFLDAGKTSLLNMLLGRRLSKGSEFLLIQFEHGEEDPIDDSEEDGSLTVFRFSIKEAQEDIQEVARRLYSYLIHHDPAEIWVEWNGVLPFSYLWDLFPSASRNATGTLGDVCQIEKILNLADAQTLERLIGQTGGTLLEQISNSDIVVLRNADSGSSYRRLKRMVQTWNPGVKVLPLKPLQNVEQAISRQNRNQSLTLLKGIVFCAAAYVVVRFVLDAWQGSSDKLDTLTNVFLGIILQAVPFLLIGVLLSSMIQIFVSQQFIERWFPKHLAGGMLFSILAGFCLPVCDCASIPVFRSLVRKGVPITAAVTFMASAPIINPVAMLSTWYAFNGDMSVVLCRIGLGILCAVLIGITFSWKRSCSEEMTLRTPVVYCACGCYAASSPDRRFGKILLFLQHAKLEFFDVGKYLILGAFVSALFQTLCGDVSWAGGKSGLLIPLVLMMGMAFALSLCSSSDAVVARSFSNQFPIGALMGFLVLGPMMDIKNLILLSGSFSKRFILRLVLTMFLVCGAVVYLAFRLGLERILL